MHTGPQIDTFLGRGGGYQLSVTSKLLRLLFGLLNYKVWKEMPTSLTNFGDVLRELLTGGVTH